LLLAVVAVSHLDKGLKMFSSAVQLLRAGFVAVGFAAISASAVAQDAPDALVRKVTDDVVAAIKSDKDVQSGNSAKILQLVDAKVLPHFDFTRMTRLAMGRNWQQTTPEQQTALIKEFRTLLVRTYSTALGQYRSQTVDVKQLKLDGKETDVTVRSTVNNGSAKIPLDYAMEKQASGWKIYDVLVDGVSLVTTYRSSFNQEIQSGGVDALVKSLAQRNATGK
jgi:phospholipid transport system substrate-binding protein